MQGTIIEGSHNSLSYSKPKYWYQWIFYPWARCQSKNILEQYDSGIRYFDIRVRFDKNNNIVFCHNFTIFDISKNEVLFDLIPISKDSYFRIVLDYRTPPKAIYQILFKEFVSQLNDLGLMIHSAILLWNGEDVFTNIVDDIKYESDYASYSNTIFKYLPPIFYKWFNKRKQFPVTEGFKCYLRDFV